MEKNIICFMFYLMPFFAFSQNVGVSINTAGAAPDNSAIFDISANGKGILIPRMPTTSRPTDPVESLLIYNTTTQCFEAYNASTSQWISIACLNSCVVPAAPSAGVSIPSATQIIWNWNAVSGATGYKWNTVNNYGTATDNGVSTTYTQTGLTCNTPYTLYVWAYNACGNSSTATLSQTSSSCTFTCGGNLVVTHTAGLVAPVTKTITYGTVQTSITGASKCWITQNLGADHKATEALDFSDASAGWYWQFNRKQGYTSAPYPTWTITSIVENSDWLASNDPCTLLLGSGWRLPTYTEWDYANRNACGSNNGWCGVGGTCPDYAEPLWIHPTGMLDRHTGALGGRSGTCPGPPYPAGFLWSSTQNDDGVNPLDDGILLQYGCATPGFCNNSSISFQPKSYGVSVRCLKD